MNMDGLYVIWVSLIFKHICCRNTWVNCKLSKHMASLRYYLANQMKKRCRHGNHETYGTSGSEQGLDRGNHTGTDGDGGLGKGNQNLVD